MTRCQPCVEKKLRKMIRERDATINRLKDRLRRLEAPGETITDAKYYPLPEAPHAATE